MQIHVYIQRFSGGNFIVLLLYVDDMLIVGQDVSMIRKLKADLSKLFNMKDLGPAKQILDMKITHDRKANKLWLSLERYVERVLERFNMKDAKLVSSPLGNHFKLSKILRQPHKRRKTRWQVSLTHHDNTRPDFAHAVRRCW